MTPFNFTSLSRSTSFSERMRHPEAKNLAAPVIAIVLLLPLMLVGTIAVELLIVFVVALATIIGLAVHTVRLYIKIGKKLCVPYFAQDNDMTFVPGPDTTPRASVFFEGGSGQRFTDMLVSTRHGFDEIGTFTFIPAPGTRSAETRRGYVHIKLPRNLPHMLLDAKSNNFLGASYLSSFDTQQLSLEGDFDKYFTLYAPKQYATDALYIFTPDIMLLLINSVHKYDCEIIDDNFYIHSDKPFELSSQAEFEEIHTITSKLAEKLDRRTDYYADSRVEGSRQTNVVAPEGARVTRSVSVVSVIIFVILCVIGLLMS